MWLVTFTHSGTSRIGIVDGDDVVDFSAAADLPWEMATFLAGGAARGPDAHR